MTDSTIDFRNITLHEIDDNSSTDEHYNGWTSLNNDILKGLLQKVKKELEDSKITKKDIKFKQKISSLTINGLYFSLAVLSLIGSNSIFDKETKSIILITSGIVNIFTTGANTYVKGYDFALKIHSINIITNFLNQLKNKISSNLIKPSKRRENAEVIIERFTNDYNTILDIVNHID